MSASCCGPKINIKDVNQNFKKVLWIALILNFGMFILENFQGIQSGSLSLRADAIDFLGDSANYFVTLFVLNSAIRTKATVSLTKAIFMFGFGIWVLIESFIRFYSDAVPNSFTMSWVGILALIINALVAFLLFRYKDGDSNMQSVWLCSRNDAIGNLAVVFASIGVYFYSSKWPDLVVALFMASLSVSASFKVLVLVRKEFESTKVECAG
jgi:Co/Zn/Cd efflux system component